MDPKAIEKVIIKRVEGENARDMPRVLATYGKDAVFDDVPGGKRFAGKDAIASNLRRDVSRLSRSRPTDSTGRACCAAAQGAAGRWMIAGTTISLPARGAPIYSPP